jgi:hypothetical protein
MELESRVHVQRADQGRVGHPGRLRPGSTVWRVDRGRRADDEQTVWCRSAPGWHRREWTSVVRLRLSIPRSLSHFDF